MARRLRKRYGCAVELAMDVLGGKWKTVILARVKQGPLAFADLRKSIPGLSDKVLSQKLRELLDLGLIEQDEKDGSGSRRLYRLTRQGEELAPTLKALFVAGERLAGIFPVTFADNAS